MQIVIDISENTYNLIAKGEENRDFVYKSDLMRAILEGTLLPKGHGRLVDISEYEEYFNTAISYDDGDAIHLVYTNNIPTIIDADKESEE